MCQGENLGPSNTFVVGFFNIRNGLQEFTSSWQPILGTAIATDLGRRKIPHKHGD